MDRKGGRPIGAIFRLGRKSTRRAIRAVGPINFGEIDVTNDKGKADFRAALVKQADKSVQVLKDTGAQGMITWDPEGEEFIYEVLLRRSAPCSDPRAGNGV